MASPYVQRKFASGIIRNGGRGGDRIIFLDENDLPVAFLRVALVDSDKEAPLDFKTQHREIATFQFCGFCMHFVDNNNAPGPSDSNRDKLW